MMVNTLFMGTPDFAVPALQALIACQNVVGVVTQPDRPAGRGRQLRPSPVKQVALAAHIPLYQPVSLKKEAAAMPIAAWQPDLIVVAAYGQILRPHLLNLPAYGCINVHASLLPRWRGASPIQHAILAGDQETGVTLMKMAVGLDTGDMFVKEKILIEAAETAASLHDKLAALGADMLKLYLDDVINGRIQATPQDSTQATYAPLISKSDGRIDWQQTNMQIDRQIRAMTPWPGAHTTWDHDTLKIISATPVNIDQTNYKPGFVIKKGETAVVITGSGGLQLNRLQLSGKRPMPINDFLRGRPDLIGATIGNKASS